MPLPCPPEELDQFISRPTDSVMQSLRGLDSGVLVLGAGGKMGLHVCLMLHRALRAIRSPHRVVAVSRFGSVNDREVFERAGMATIACDLCDPQALAQLPDCRNIIFLAGIKFGTSGRPDLLRQMNIEMPAAVGDRFRGARMVALSTGCVYSPQPIESAGATEESPTDPPGDYAQSCLGREHAFADAAQRHGSQVALIRLNYSVELRYGVLLDIAQLVHRGEPVDVSIPTVNVIWQGDAVAQIIQTLQLAENPPFILNVSGPEKLAVAELAQEFGRRFRREPVITGEPVETAWISDASRAEELFGAPETTRPKMLDWVAAWVEAGLPTLNKPTGFAKTDGKF